MRDVCSFTHALCLAILVAAAMDCRCALAQDSKTEAQELYRESVAMIPMQDGTKLYTEPLRTTECRECGADPSSAYALWSCGCERRIHQVCSHHFPRASKGSLRFAVQEKTGTQQSGRRAVHIATGFKSMSIGRVAAR